MLLLLLSATCHVWVNNVWMDHQVDEQCLDEHYIASELS